MVRFCKGVWTVLRKLHSCIKSTSNISYEHNKVQECNQTFWHKKHTKLKKYWFLFICLAYLTVGHTGRNNHKYLVTCFHQILACAMLGLSQAHIMSSPIGQGLLFKAQLSPISLVNLFKPNKLFSTVCEILHKKLTFSESESSKHPEAHAPSKNSLKGFRFSEQQTNKKPYHPQFLRNDGPDLYKSA